MVYLKAGLARHFRQRSDVFVAGDLLWYPVRGKPKVRIGPDALVAFGRPPGTRGSYKQWEEGDIPPQVVFEVLSPGNTFNEMYRKFRFYERHGVEEYYIFDPDRQTFEGFQRAGGRLRKIRKFQERVSPLLDVRFEIAGDLPRMVTPDGQPILSLEEVDDLLASEWQRADRERQRADQERQRAEQERHRAEAAERRVAELEARLRSLGHTPNGSPAADS